MKNLCNTCKNRMIIGDLITKPDEKVSKYPESNKPYYTCYFRHMILNNIEIKNCSYHDK